VLDDDAISRTAAVARKWLGKDRFDASFVEGRGLEPRAAVVGALERA